MCITATTYKYPYLHRGTQWGIVDTFYTVLMGYYNKSNVDALMLMGLLVGGGVIGGPVGFAYL